MKKCRLLWIVVLDVAALIWLPHPVYAYLDPGTTGSIFAWLAPVIVIFVGFLGLLLRPVRVLLIRPFARFFDFIHAKLLGGPMAESDTGDEQPVLGDSLDDEKSEGSTNEHPKG